MRDAISVGVSLAAGIALARYDLHTDDTGIEIGLLLGASVVLALLTPKRWWLVALSVGVPIPVAEMVVAHAPLPPAGIAALGVAIVGALIGCGIARASRVGPA